MAGPTDTHITELLVAWGGGDRAALDQLLPLVYDELHWQAARYLGRERPDHTLQPTALVHEAYLRLMDHQALDWQGRTHFFALASTTMRRILVSHARQHRSAKRGQGGVAVTLCEEHAVAEARDVDLMALDAALSELERLDSRQCRVVELRYFAGLTADQAAEALGISPSTADRHWAFARAWLYDRLRRDG